jgi:hypothetical protein
MLYGGKAMGIVSLQDGTAKLDPDGVTWVRPRLMFSQIRDQEIQLGVSVYTGSACARWRAPCGADGRSLHHVRTASDLQPAIRPGNWGELLVGTLMAGEGTACVQLKAPGQSAVALLWPLGFTAKANPLRIYSPQRSEVAAEGDTVTAGGVFVDKWSIACKAQGYFEVLQVIRGAPSFAP